MTTYGTTAAAQDDPPLPCPRCGYDLRGSESGVCPECGESIDLAKVRGTAPLPWADRRRLGRPRAFARQVWQGLRRPSDLAGFVGRPVDYRSARTFQLLCCAIGWLALVPPVTLLFLKVRLALIGGTSDWSAYQAAVVPLLPVTAPDRLLDGFVWLAAMIGLFVWLVTASGVPSYFCHPRDAPVRVQNSAVALSYYAAAVPLLIAPLPILLLTIAFAVGRGWQMPASATTDPFIRGPGGLLAAGLLAYLSFCLFRGPAALLTAGLGRSRRRVGAMSLTLLVAWPALFVACVVVPALLVWWAEAVILALLN